MAKPDGGQAFPRAGFGFAYRDEEGAESESSQDGMSLRDYFAIKALPAVTAGDHTDGQGDPERHAAQAYRYADAMLAERKKE
jgi:hypothetical protein